MDPIHTFLPTIGPLALALAFTIALLAGFIKGMVGFAMPMIMISGLSSVMPPEVALAGLILPTLVTNGMQALRQGPAAAIESVGKFRLFLLVGCLALVASSQLVRVLSGDTLLLIIGSAMLIFAAMQLSGRLPVLEGRSMGLEIGIGIVAGLVGGMSGVWGPPVVIYLTAMGTEKRDQVRIQGVIYGLGAVALTFAHIASGVLTWHTAVISAALVPPAILGMWLGGRVQDRIDQAVFRKATLVVLIVAALNLVRRGLMG